MGTGSVVFASTQAASHVRFSTHNVRDKFRQALRVEKQLRRLPKLPVRSQPEQFRYANLQRAGGHAVGIADTARSGWPARWRWFRRRAGKTSLKSDSRAGTGRLDGSTRSNSRQAYLPLAPDMFAASAFI